MLLPPLRCLLVTVLASIVASAKLSAGSAPAHSDGARPRLAVVIVIDQFRGDYLDRFGPHFGEGGFNRLRREGADFAECHYRHGITKTAPGHATILSGVHANVHGIVSNEWLDVVQWREVASVEDPTAPLVGAAPRGVRSPGGIVEAKAGRSPRSFLSTTVSDQLKLRYGVAARVFTVAHKDRSAILLGGKLADSAYWIEEGRFVTSTYYRAELPAWVREFNDARRVEAMFGSTWELLLASEIYAAVQHSEDDAPGETAGFGFARTMPKRLDGGRAEISPQFYEAFENDPRASDFVAEFARLAVREEKLGQGAQPDMLCLGFSQIDKVGHSYGPDSFELMDSLLRLDRLLADFLRFLDAEVGAGRYTVVLTSDHGAAPLPERMHALRPEIPAGRMDRAGIDATVNRALAEALGELGSGERWATRDNFAYHLNAPALAARGIDRAAAARVACEALRTQPEVASAHPAEEVLAWSAEGESLEAMLRRSFFPGRSGDLLFLLRPYFMDRPGAGTNHGSPYRYDTHVPLLWFGAGVPRGRFHQRVGVDNIAATLAPLLDVPAPEQTFAERLF